MNNIRFGGLVFLFAAMAGAVLMYQGQTGRPGVMPDIVRIGVLPDENEAVLRERYTPLVEYLSGEVGVPFELIVPADYDELLDLFGRKEVDVAVFGGFTFLLANDRYNAVPVVMRDIDVAYESYFLAKADRADGQIEIVDFKGDAFAFGASLSTSGHLMPRYFLEQEGIDAENFFSGVVYSGAHDRTADWVATGRVDLGAASARVVDMMYLDGRLDPKEVEIIWTTPPYPDYIWAAQEEIGAAALNQILMAFLSLDLLNEEDRIVLKAVGARGFLPASLSDFEELRLVAMKRGLL